MKIRMITFATLMLLAVLAISAVSANDDLTGTDDGVLKETSIEEQMADDDSAVLSSSQDEIIKETGEGTFTALQEKINNAEENSTITLESDYAYDDDFGVNGISITKSLTIDGNNKTIDANSKSRIFRVTSGNVVLKNIIFKGGYNDGATYDNGGAIYNSGNNCSIISCSFVNCYDNYWGGAIFLYRGSNNCSIVSCDFVNCSAKNHGGAVYIIGGADNCSVVSCDFVNCSASPGGAICNYGGNFNISSCNFQYCSGDGGAIRNYGDNSIIHSCDFVNCSYNNSNGGSIANNGNNCSLISCNFINCSNNNCGSVYNCGNNFTVFSCSFLNCSARIGGAVYIDVSADKCNITLSNFTNCYASKSGGAIRNGGTNCSVSLCEFIKCYSGTDSSTTRDGAIYGDVVIDECIFIDIIPQATIIEVSPLTTSYNADDYLIATLKNSTGSPLAGLDVYVDLDGVKNFTTDNNGKIYIPTKGLALNTYDVVIRFNGSENYMESNANTTLIVGKGSTSLSAGAVVTTYNVAKNLVITLKDSQGNALSNISVSVNLNGVKSLKTDENGQIKIAVGSLLPKTYNVKINFAGNENYNATSETVKVTVKKATPKIAAKLKSFKKAVKIKKYRITLKNNKNNVMKNKKVYIKIKKKTYAAKTNKKGVATFKIKKLTKKGTYKPKITYKGDKYYKKVTKKVKIKVK